MANKDKLLVSVQKYLEKGRTSKAISVLEKIVKVDPKDSRCLLKIAELYAQEGKRDKAVETYQDVAKFFLDNNFFLKAIAVFKQILKLAPEKKELYKQLGELNERQGLIGNALSEYRRLAEYYQQEEMISETHGVLKKMAELDPKNIPVRMKVAEYSYRLDAKDEAKNELDLIHSILQEKEDHPALGKFYDFYLSLFPEEFAIELVAAERKLVKESPEVGIAALETLRKKEPENVKLLQALANGYKSTKNVVSFKSTLNELLNLCPEDLDLCQKCIHACVVADDQAEAVAILEKWKETFQAQNRVSELQDLYERLAEEFSGEEKNKGVFSSLRTIIKSTTDYSKGVDFGSYARPSEEEGISSTNAEVGRPVESGPGEVLLGVDGIEEEKSESIELVEETEDFVLETTGDAGAFSLSATSDEAVAEGTPTTDKNSAETGVVKTEDQSGEEALEFEDSFFDFDLSDDDSDSEVNAEGPDPHSELEEADFYLRQGLFEEAERVCNKILDARSDFKEAKSKLAQIEQKRSESLASTDHGNAAGKSAASENLSIDLFSQEGDGDDFFLDGLVADSQKGVKTVIGQEDTESHFNLGIAYKEMGQFDEAIAEFEQAKTDPVRYVDCITLMTGCMVEKGSYQEAEEVFLSALADDISDDDRIIINFEMGLFYSDQGKSSEALDKFHFVLNLDPFYRDVGERVKKLQESLGGDDSFQEDEAMNANSRKSRVSYV